MRARGSLRGACEQVRLVAMSCCTELTAAITGLRSFWMQGGEALSAIGALDYPKEERKRLAKLYVLLFPMRARLTGRSQDWSCPTCGVKNRELLSDAPPSSSSAPIATASEPAEAPVAPLAVGDATPIDIAAVAAAASPPADVDRPRHSAPPPASAPAASVSPETLTRPTATIPAPVTTLPSHVAHVPPIPAATLTQRYIAAGSQVEPARDARPAQQVQAAPATRISSPPTWLPSFQSMRQLIDLSILFLVFVLLGMLVRRVF